MADVLGKASHTCAQCRTDLPADCLFCPECGASTVTGRPSGPVIDGYTIVRTLGQGGAAVVYLAQQESLDRQVAIKVLRRDLEEPKVWRQFRREARTIARLTGHPNVVTVYTAGRSADGQPYLVTEYLDRGSLADVIAAGGPLPPAVVAKVGVAIADALTAAHGLGILHRDVKPGNVMMDHHGRVKLGDFGIARLLVGHGTTTDVFAFTPEHVAPEVLRGERDGPASDLYGLASTLTAALGTPLFARRPDERVDALLARKLMGPPPGLPSSVPASLAAPLARSLDPDPACRPSLAELRQQLATAGAAMGAPLPPPPAAAPAGAIAPRAARAGAPAGAVARPRSPGGPETGTSPPPPARRPRRRLVAVAAVLGAAVAVTLLVGLITRRGGDGAADSTTPTVTVPAAAAPTAPAATASPSAAAPATTAATIAATTTTPPTVSATTATTVAAPVTSATTAAVVLTAPPPTVTATTPSTVAVPAAAGPPPATPTAPDTETFVRSYYDAVNAGDYETSWSQLAPAFQRGKARSFEYYVGFWDDNDIEVGEVEVVAVDPDQTIVNVDLRWNGTGAFATDQFTLRPGEDGQLRIARQESLDD